MSNNTLPESTRDRIEKEANKQFMSAGYLAGAKAEAIRSMGLVEALESCYIILGEISKEYKKNTLSDATIAEGYEMYLKAEQALKEYNHAKI